MTKDHQCGFQRNTSTTDKTLFRQTQKKSQTVYYNVTLRRVHLTVVAVQMQYQLSIMMMRLHSCKGFGTKSACALLYPQLCPFWLYYIFPHYLINGKIFGKNFTENKMCALIFPTTLSKTLMFF